jgi:hypothetical protein
MEPIPTPTITVSFAIDLELTYDPFKGKSTLEFVDLVEDDLYDALMDFRPEVIAAYTSITAINDDNV